MKLSTAANRRVSGRSGFTLLEVLVVVAILVILASVGIVATTKYLEDAKKNKAQLQCQSIAEACEAYYLNPQSGNQYPSTTQELLSPPFGGQSYFKNGQADLASPWGTGPNAPQFVISTYTNSDGSVRPLVQIQALDGIMISQFGVGPLSTPPQH